MRKGHGSAERGEARHARRVIHNSPLPGPCSTARTPQINNREDQIQLNPRQSVIFALNPPAVQADWFLIPYSGMQEALVSIWQIPALIRQAYQVPAGEHPGRPGCRVTASRNLMSFFRSSAAISGHG